MRVIVVVALFLLTACATTPVVDAPTALNGREIETALNLYGRYDQRVVLDGKPHYVWRRAVILSGQTYYCELRAEIGYRNIIRASIVEGYPAACSLFAVQYTATPDPPAAKRLPAANPSVIADSSRNFRPVGSPAQSASATRAGKDASERPQGSRAARGGS